MKTIFEAKNVKVFIKYENNQERFIKNAQEVFQEIIVNSSGEDFKKIFKTFNENEFTILQFAKLLYEIGQQQIAKANYES